MEFFPINSLSPKPNCHVFRADWYASHLLAMEERPLHSTPPGQLSVYRLLFLPTFEQPSVIRLTEAGSGWRILCKRSDGLGGYAPGQLASAEERQFSELESAQFIRLLERVGFWTMQPSDEVGLDGSHAVLEGVSAGRYHVVNRWSPHATDYAELVEFLLESCRSVGELATGRNTGFPDREALQGVWTVYQQELPCVAHGTTFEQFVFAGDILIWKELKQNAVNIAYTLLGGTNPKAMDLGPSRDARGRIHRRITHAIYAQEGDVLTFCYRGPGMGRPNMFTTGGGSVIIKLRREDHGT